MMGGPGSIYKEYILYFIGTEEPFQAFRNETANLQLTHPPNLFFFFRWLFQILDMEQELQRKWEWQVFKISRLYCKGYISSKTSENAQEIRPLFVSV